jgi:hypothetical protein
MKNINLKIIYIDVGSTMIKIAESRGTTIVKRTFIQRNLNKKVGDEVAEIINKLKSKYPNVKFKICSSANGGLRVGLISLTKRFSGEISKRIIMSSGCNLIWHASSNEFENLNVKIDALVISGGLNVKNAKYQKLWMKNVIEHIPSNIPVIYCGNSFLKNIILKKLPNANIIENIMNDNIKINYLELSSSLKQLYMLDLIQKDGISNLQEHSIIPIWPTPAICQNAFLKITEHKTHMHFSQPILMIDMGGATTDVFYGKELISNINELKAEALSINRYVYTSIGVKSSKESVIIELNENKFLYDIINCISEENQTQKRYINFRDNELSWISEEDLFYMCFGIVLEKLVNGIESGHPIVLEKINTIIITGGASKKCKIEILNKIYKLYLGDKITNSPEIFIDKKYEIWNIGIATL